MILSFDSGIFNSQDPAIAKPLSKILSVLAENRTYLLLDTNNVDSMFYNEEDRYIFNDTLVARKFMSDDDKEELKNYIEHIIYSTPTQLQKFFLTTIRVGLDKSTFTPEQVLRIVTHPSMIVIENYPNDWKFLKACINKYSTQSKSHFKSIYKLIQNSLQSEFLSYDHGGGVGSIVNQVEGWFRRQRLKGICHLKLMIFFDSDRVNLSTEYNFRRKSLVQYMYKCEREHGFFTWHMTYKRCIENYVPIKYIIEIIDLDQKTKIEKEEKKSKVKFLTTEETDFIRYEGENSPIGISKDTVKKEFPEYFLERVTYRDLEERCQHHKVIVESYDNQEYEVSEIEYFLLKIAKII